MNNHFELNDLVFSLQFEQCILDPRLFDHEAHLRLAWIQIDNYGIDQAIKNVDAQILKFVNHVGEKDKFNRTLTVAAVHVVHHFKQKSKSDNFRDFIMEFPRLKSNFKDLIFTHYKLNIFNSEKAKKVYFEPDILPFT